MRKKKVARGPRPDQHLSQVKHMEKLYVTMEYNPGLMFLEL